MIFIDGNEQRFSDFIDEGAEFIPLLSSEDEEQMDNEDTPNELPILPLRNTVLFPGVVIPITVGRDKSIKLVQDAYHADKIVGVVTQLDQQVENPNFEQLNKIGTVAHIIKLLKMPDGSTTIIIQGKKRFKLLEKTQEKPYLKAKVQNFNEIKPPKKDKNFAALVASVKELSLNIIKQSPTIPSEASMAIKNIESSSFLINFISSNMHAAIEDKQKMLEEENLHSRATMVLRFLTKELQELELKNDIQSKVRVDIDQQQREYFLHQQMKTIQEELGGDPVSQEVEDMKKKALKKKWSKTVNDTFYKELDKLQRMNSASAEYSVQTNYLEVLLDLPWGKYSKDKFDLKRASKILDRDHYGLDKVKERILEHLAVLKMKGDMKSPILCLYGPPGVGKTSLGKSIASALGRSYVRMSLGGLRDEAEIRGHRKTYIGAMPGRILQNLKKAKISNPVFILDELDKVGTDHHGDPSSALLEVLDPEQNNAFNDNFVELDYDLSKVLFIATANSLNTIQPALRDRLEIIEVNGYSLEEKIEIAKKHLIPKQLKEHGITKAKISFTTPILSQIIEQYTFESGVRRLENRIAQVIRKTVKCIALEEHYNKIVTPQDIEKYLGVGHAKDKYQGNDIAGVVTGLAWTQNGGDILFIESILTPGKGKLNLTGNLGAVMKESAVIALEYLKAHAGYLSLDNSVFEKWNIHVHVPEGATPKDGPSAGITMLTALASVYTQRKVKPHLAMTGEITLRGKVLPVGGIKEKMLAAKRANIKELILCKDNQKDVEDIDPKYLVGLKFNYVTDMLDVLDLALTEQKVENPVLVE